MIRYFVDFVIFSFLGWVYECIFCTIRTGHWQNRGFLFGPVCPIYGFGALGIIVLSDYMPAHILVQMPLWQLFLIFMTGSAVLEYVTSFALEKIFHARWWDYSSMPLNLNGRICLPASLLFAAMGTAGYCYVLPLLGTLRPSLPEIMVEAAGLLSAGILGADLSLSAASMSHLLMILEESQSQFNERVEERVQAVRQIPEIMSEKTDEVKNRLFVQPREKLKLVTLTKREEIHLKNIRVFTQQYRQAAKDYAERSGEGEKNETQS